MFVSDATVRKGGKGGKTRVVRTISKFIIVLTIYLKTPRVTTVMTAAAEKTTTTMTTTTMAEKTTVETSEVKRCDLQGSWGSGEKAEASSTFPGEKKVTKANFLFCITFSNSLTKNKSGILPFADLHNAWVSL